MECKVHIDGLIGTGKNKVSAVDVQRQINSYKGAESITVYIDSEGGSIDEANDIISVLEATKLPIKTVVRGNCASAATLIQLLGTERLGFDNSKYMIHEPLFTELTNTRRDDLLELAARLDNMINTVSAKYSEVSGKPVEEIKELMKEDRSMSYDEAEALNFFTGKYQKASKAEAQAVLMQSLKTNNKQMLDEMKGLFDSFEKRFFRQMKMQATKLKDGTDIEVSELIENGTVTVGGEPAPDGTHELESGVKIVTEGGIIKSIMKPEKEGLEIEIENLKKANMELQAKCDEMKAAAEMSQKKEAEMVAEMNSMKGKFDKAMAAIEMKMQAQKEDVKTTQNIFEKFKGLSAEEAQRKMLNEKNK